MIALLFHARSVGVSLKLQGITISNNSLVEFSDLLYRTNSELEREDPSNSNPTFHDAALLCVTDLVDCCESPQPHGNWFYPESDGRVVQFDEFPNRRAFWTNRGQNEIRNGISI